MKTLENAPNEYCEIGLEISDLKRSNCGCSVFCSPNNTLTALNYIPEAAKTYKGNSMNNQG